MSSVRGKPYRGVGMEGFIARWYAKNTAADMDDIRRTAHAIASSLPPGVDVLEVAPGPGYLAIELAKLGDYRVAGLDISRSFVTMASDNAHKAGVNIDFRLGDAQALPFTGGSFAFIVCRAAFKNFSEPVKALSEMRRVLKPDGTALIIDMRNDVSDATIDQFVKARGDRGINAMIMRWTFKNMLRKRAYGPSDMRAMATRAGFTHCDVKETLIGMDVRLRP